MSLQSLRAPLWVLIAAFFLAACGGSSNKDLPGPPVGGLSLEPGDSQVTVSWKETPGVEYWIFASPNNPNVSMSTWLASTGSTYRLKVNSPFIVSGLLNGTPYSFFMTSRVNSGPGGEASPTVISTPRLAGSVWKAGTKLNTGAKTGMTYGGVIDTATNTVKYVYVAVGQEGRMFSASSIDAWTALTPVIKTDLNTAGFGLGKFLALGAAGKILYSTDAQTWLTATSATSQNLNALAVSGNFAVAVGDNGTIITSKDAMNWSIAKSVPTTAHLLGVTYAPNGTWAAVGASGTLLTSSDGLTWTSQTTGTLSDLKTVGALATAVNTTTNTYTYVAVGNNGTIISSPDALTWTTRNAGTSESFNDMSSINQFLAVGSRGTIVTSSDGINWTQQTSNSVINLNTLLRADNQYVVVNSAGDLIYSK